MRWRIFKSLSYSGRWMVREVDGPVIYVCSGWRQAADWIGIYLANRWNGSTDDAR